MTLYKKTMKALAYKVEAEMFSIVNRSVPPVQVIVLINKSSADEFVLQMENALKERFGFEIKGLVKIEAFYKKLAPVCLKIVVGEPGTPGLFTFSSTEPVSIFVETSYFERTVETLDFTNMGSSKE